MLDADSADFRVQQNAYINMQDLRFGPTSDKGFSEQLEAVGGTLLKANANLPAGQNYCVGYATDYPNRRVVLFNWNANGNHGIYCYDYVQDRIDPVLLTADVPEGLNFDKNHLIHSARVENGCVYWTDNFNEPRRINITAGLEMYYTNATLPASYILTPNFLPKDNSDLLNLHPAGMTCFTFYYPTNPVLAYTVFPGMSFSIKAVGTDGHIVGPDPIIMAWGNVPTEGVAQVIVDGLVFYLLGRGVRNTDWDAEVGNGFVSVYLRNSWDFGTGDGTWGTTASLDLYLGYYLHADGSLPNPYVSPVSENIISWIRRQPALPPTFTKMTQTVPALSSNLVAQDAVQFCYRYIYHDGELSTLSPDSLLANFNADQDTFNRIDVQIPLGEAIAQDVLQIDLVVRYFVSGIFFVIHSWRKGSTSDVIAIDAHNAGTTPLSYSFYNDVAGIALDAAYSVKPFDSVPLLAQTIESAKQRAFMGNYTIGYDSPTISSLALTTAAIVLNTGSATTVSGEWYLLKWKDPFFVPGSSYVVVTFHRVLGTESFGAQYIYTYSSPVPPFPSFINASTLTFRGNSAFTAAAAIQGGAVILPSLTDQAAAVLINTGTVIGTGTVLATVFKSYASYQLGVRFIDRYGRVCGEVTSPAYTVNTPDVFAGGTVNYNYVNGIAWTLSNNAAAMEIPDWAWYYSVDITLCLRTRFFVQGVGLVIYAARDSSNNYTFTTTVYSSSLAGVAIDISGLQSYAQGYIFSQGDSVRLFINFAYYNLAVIGQSGQYIICQLTDVGSLSAISGHYEIFTPYQRQNNEPFYEEAEIFPVSSPGQADRQYSTLSGNIGGDVYVFSRGGYLTEGMNITDKHYTNWFTNAGRPNFIDYIGQVTHRSTIAWSNTFIAGAQNNGLSTFDALDTQDISPDFGPIQKLQLASKVSKVGTVMLAICSGPTTASIYLGENTLISQTGDSVIAQANTVIGSIHELKGGFGTLNPESVVEFRGNIYWFDVQNGMIIQYADNGLFPVSNYKLSRYWKLYSDTYKMLSQAAIEALGNRPFVFGGVDPHHGEILFSVPKVLASPPNGFLPDYPSIPYPFDIWDGQGKTLVYKLYTDPNHWQGAYSFSPDYLFSLENNLFSLKNGQLYLHNQTNYSNYYGTQVNPAVMGVANQQPTKPKVWNNFSAEADVCPSLVYFMSLYPNAQASDLLATDLTALEGIFYAPLYRNKFDPAFNNPPLALTAGEKMRTTALYYMAQWTGGTLAQVKFLNLGYVLSVGQKV